MNETKLSKTTNPATDEQARATQGVNPVEIRLLDDYELVLAGGGDTVVGWP